MTDLSVDEFDPGYDLPPPSDGHLRKLADELGFELSDETFQMMAERVRASVRGLKALKNLEPVQPPTRHPRLAGTAPKPGENKFNAWSWRCEVKGSESGPLSGLSMAVKESVAVAGVPMSNGSALLDGHIPSYDATVVTRLLDAGATISGKATSENLGLSSGSNTSSNGPVLNPAAPGRATGGSSSGCAALVAAGDCDASVGTDQGGSVRTPASLCGIVGLKPTFGAVPYTGVFSIETSLDHVGFFGRDVATVESLFEVASGSDGLDPRQGSVSATGKKEPRGDRPMRVAVLEEGLELLTDPTQAREQMDLVIEDLRSKGVEVSTVSIPEHVLSGLVTISIYAEGICSQLFESGGTSLGWKGFYPEHELTSMLRAIRLQPSLIPDTGKLFAILGAHLRETHLGRYYSRSQNIAVTLRSVYDSHLDSIDALLMPTCAPEPVALPLPVNPTADEVFEAAFGYHLNAGVFNLTGHPGLSVPAGTIDDLPFGVMLVGAHEDERSLLQIGELIHQGTKAREVQK